MPTKHSNTVYYALGSLAILFSLFVYWAASDIPLPKNTKKVGDMIHIDISEGAANDTEKKEGLFVVPEKFRPDVFERGFAFYFKYPVATPYTGNESPTPTDRVRVVVRHHEKTSALPSEGLVQRTQPKNGPLFATPWFVEAKDGLEIYQYRIDKTTIGTYFKLIATDGSNILADDPGGWSRVYLTYRKLSPHIELNYLPPRSLVRDSKHLVEDISAIDNAVLKLVQSFQSK